MPEQSNSPELDIQLSQVDCWVLPPQTPVQSCTQSLAGSLSHIPQSSGAGIQLPSSSLASALKLQALELVQPGTSSGSVVQLKNRINVEIKYLKLYLDPFSGNESYKDLELKMEQVFVIACKIGLLLLQQYHFSTLRNE